MKDITKKDIVLKGKSMYASVHEPRTSKFEGQEEKTFYEMMIILDDESENTIMRMAEGLKIIDNLDGDIVPLRRTEMGEATVRVKKNDSFRSKTGEMVKVEPVKVFLNKELTKELVGNGSDVTVHAKMGLFESSNGIYPFFQFKYVIVDNLIKYEPKVKQGQKHAF